MLLLSVNVLIQWKKNLLKVSDFQKEKKINSMHSCVSPPIWKSLFIVPRQWQLGGSIRTILPFDASNSRRCVFRKRIDIARAPAEPLSAGWSACPGAILFSSGGRSRVIGVRENKARFCRGVTMCCCRCRPIVYAKSTPFRATPVCAMRTRPEPSRHTAPFRTAINLRV